VPVLPVDVLSNFLHGVTVSRWGCVRSGNMHVVLLCVAPLPRCLGVVVLWATDAHSNALQVDTVTGLRLAGWALDATDWAALSQQSSMSDLRVLQMDCGLSMEHLSLVLPSLQWLGVDAAPSRVASLAVQVRGRATRPCWRHHPAMDQRSLHPPATAACSANGNLITVASTGCLRRLCATARTIACKLTMTVRCIHQDSLHHTPTSPPLAMTVGCRKPDAAHD
jgi:hypothetical protein